MTAHTPTPWTHRSLSDHSVIRNSEGNIIAELWDVIPRTTIRSALAGDRKANGDLIVDSANAHSALIAALQDAREAIYNLGPRNFREQDCANRTPNDPECPCTLHKIRAVLGDVKKKARKAK